MVRTDHYFEGFCSEGEQRASIIAGRRNRVKGSLCLRVFWVWGGVLGDYTASLNADSNYPLASKYRGCGEIAGAERGCRQLRREGRVPVERCRETGSPESRRGGMLS